MTTADLQDYISVIEKMKSLINSAEFDQVFALLTSGLPKSKQFLLKMELKRMAQPCDYFIDLRGHVSGDVRAYPYGNKVHYLDDNAIRIFENGLKQYGQYTVGLYEEIMNADNNYRVIHRKETEQRVQEALDKLNSNDAELLENEEPDAQPNYARLLQLGRYSVRNEERMNFAADVDILLENDRFTSTTSDLSVSGCRLKIFKNNHRNVKPGQQLKLVFKGLEQEFTINTQAGIPYEVVETEPGEKYDYWRLKRLNSEDASFSQFLQNFIQANKRRYKVNLDNMASTVTVKGYEQFYIARLSNLPVYVAVQNGYAIPVFALTTDYNRAIWRYFQDERQQAVLINILSGKRLKQLLQQESPEKSTILYCFTHAAKGSLYFYSATTEELDTSAQLKALFLGFGSTKKSWRVFHVNVLRSSPKNSITPSSVPAEHDKSQTVAELPPVLLRPLLKDIRYIVSLTDITSESAVSNYQWYDYQTEQLKQLSRFAHSRLKDAPVCAAIPVQYVNLRSESRYLYKTSVEILLHGERLPAFTRDFSVKGLQIESSIPLSLQKGEIISLSLPDMQQLSDRFYLQELPYKVVAISKSGTIINLRAPETKEPHTGKLFFQRLIQNNLSKLTPAEEAPKYPGLSDALRNMYLSVMNNVVFYLHRQGIRYNLDVVATGADQQMLEKMLQTTAILPGEQADLSLLLKDHSVNLEFASQLKNMKRSDLPKTYELYIRVPKESAQPQDDAVSYYDYEFSSEEDKLAFLTDALEQDLLYGFRIFLSRTGRPDIEYITRELNYISSYALHRARVVEEDLWTVAGVAEVTDITKELPARLGLLCDESQPD